MIDITRPIQTRGGLAARLLATDLKNQHSLVVAISGPGETEGIATFHPNGRYNQDCEGARDLVNVPLLTYTFFNVYNGGRLGYSKTTLEGAKAAVVDATAPPLVILKVTMDNGKPVKAELVPA